MSKLMAFGFRQWSALLSRGEKRTPSDGYMGREHKGYSIITELVWALKRPDFKPFYHMIITLLNKTKEEKISLNVSAYGERPIMFLISGILDQTHPEIGENIFYYFFKNGCDVDGLKNEAGGYFLEIKPFPVIADAIYDLNFRLAAFLILHGAHQDYRSYYPALKLERHRQEEVENFFRNLDGIIAIYNRIVKETELAKELLKQGKQMAAWGLIKTNAEFLIEHRAVWAAEKQWEVILPFINTPQLYHEVGELQQKAADELANTEGKKGKSLKPSLPETLRRRRSLPLPEPTGTFTQRLSDPSPKRGATHSKSD